MQFMDMSNMHYICLSFFLLLCPFFSTDAYSKGAAGAIVPSVLQKFNLHFGIFCSFSLRLVPPVWSGVGGV